MFIHLIRHIIWGFFLCVFSLSCVLVDLSVSFKHTLKSPPSIILSIVHLVIDVIGFVSVASSHVLIHQHLLLVQSSSLESDLI